MGKHADNLHGSLELLVLKTLERGENHGFGITSHVKQASEGLLQIEEGSLYPALHRMEREKLIDGTWSTTDSGRRAKLYTITGPGKRRLADARENWKTVARGVKRVLKFE